MSKQNVFDTFILLLAFAAFLTIDAQPPNKKEPAADPQQKPRKMTPEPADVFKKWVEEVGPIITPQERAAISKLTTDEERENFIKIFWDRRDPSPDTQENEYREAYYERIAYANEHFASGIPGWKTDRGRIYITWGKPDSVESQPSGGSYEKPSYEGSGSATTYPFETWFYRHLDGVGDGIEIQFVDTTGSGEYRLARDFNEKYITFGPPQSVDTNASYLREQDMPFNVLDRNARLFSAPPIAGSRSDTILNGNTPLLDKNPINVELQIGFFRQSENRVITTFTLQTDNGDLQFEQTGGLGVARLNIGGRITSVAGRPVENFEDSVATNATASELVNIKNQRSIYQKAAALPPGNYKIDVVVRDIITGNRGVVSMGFKVPKYDDRTLSASTLVLASTMRATDARDTGNRFVVGNTKLIPNLMGEYKPGERVGVYMQVYNAGIDQTTLRPAVDVDYVLLKDGKEISRVKEDWSGLSDSGQRLTLARLLPTENLPPGDYDVKVVVKDKVNGITIENKGTFIIVKYKQV